MVIGEPIFSGAEVCEIRQVLSWVNYFLAYVGCSVIIDWYSVIMDPRLLADISVL